MKIFNIKLQELVTDCISFLPPPRDQVGLSDIHYFCLCAVSRKKLCIDLHEIFYQR